MTEPHNPPQDDALPEPVKRRRTAILVLTASLLVVIGAFFYYVNRPKDYIVIPTVNNNRDFHSKRHHGMDIYINKKGEIKPKAVNIPHQIEAILWLFIREKNLVKNYPTFLPAPRYYELIDKYGRIQLLGDPLSLVELQIFARNALTLYGSDMAFLIFADENAEYHDIQPVLNLLKDEGFGRIRMAVQDEDHNLRGTRVDISDVNPGQSPFVITVE
jgi:hypothetical protein